MIGLLAFTGRGEVLSHRISDFFPNESCIFYNREKSTAREFVNENFNKVDKIIFVGALGIAVRLISAHIVKKDKDPAVICVDEMGKYVISVLSGHIGGGNELASYLADCLEAEPVITTATDLSGVWACDVWAVKNNCRVANTDEIKTISGALLQGEKVGLKSDFYVTGAMPDGIYMVEEGRTEGEYTGNKEISKTDSCNYAGFDVKKQGLDKGICISHDDEKKPFARTLNLVPVNVVLGVGCRRNTRSEAFEAFILENLKEHNISVKAVARMASIDLKKDEACIKHFSEKYGIGCKFFSARELMEIPGEFHHSDFVEKTTGADNVCERSAAGVGAKKFILGKKSKDGMTIAMGIKDWKGKF